MQLHNNNRSKLPKEKKDTLKVTRPRSKKKKKKKKVKVREKSMDCRNYNPAALPRHQEEETPDKTKQAQSNKRKISFCSVLICSLEDGEIRAKFSFQRAADMHDKLL